LRSKLVAANYLCKNESPKILELVAPDRTTLAIGVGGDLSFLNYVEKEGWPAYSSIGDSGKSGFLEFTMNGYYTEVPAKYGVPFAVVLEAACQFFKTINKPQFLEWEEN
jgi:Immunity protein Imm1